MFEKLLDLRYGLLSESDGAVLQRACWRSRPTACRLSACAPVPVTWRGQAFSKSIVVIRLDHNRDLIPDAVVRFVKHFQIVAESCGTSLAPVGPQLPYLAVHLVQGLADPGLQPRPAVVGEVPRQPPRLFEEHAHILQLRKLRFGHLPAGAPVYSPAHASILLCFARFPNFAFRPAAIVVRAEFPENCYSHLLPDVQGKTTMPWRRY